MNSFIDIDIICLFICSMYVFVSKTVLLCTRAGNYPYVKKTLFRYGNVYMYVHANDTCE